MYGFVGDFNFKYAMCKNVQANNYLSWVFKILLKLVILSDCFKGTTK